MRAMVLSKSGELLRQLDIATPEPGPEQLLIRVNACGVCRTDLHIIDGELDRPKLPLVMGHEIIGTVVKKGLKVERFSIGDRAMSFNFIFPLIIFLESLSKFFA